MNNTNDKFCFSTLALGERYRKMTKTLAEDLKKIFSGYHASGRGLINPKIYYL